MSTEPTQDPIFLQGLAAIVGPLREQGASEDEVREVTERAWEFYQRSQAGGAGEGNTVPPSGTSSLPTAIDSATNPTAAFPASATSATSPPLSAEPPYPVSFSELAAMIASGAPIAGIKDIPDRLAEGSPAPSTVDLAGVRKPWEVAAGEGKGADAAGEGVGQT